MQSALNHPGTLVRLILTLTIAVTASATDKIPVKNLDDLPRHTYQLQGSASELLTNNDQFQVLAKQVRADLEADLAKYDIQDATTLKRYYGVLLSLDMLAENYDAALQRIEKIRDLEEKEAAKLLTGLTTQAYIAARKVAPENPEHFRAMFALQLLARLHELPWDVVGDEIESRKGMAEIISENLILGMIKSSVDPVVAKTNGKISGDIAQGLVNRRYALDIVIPLKNELARAYATVIDTHRVDKPDIWEAREVTLKPDESLQPVTVAIWDSGLDTSIFSNQLFINHAEPLDGKDSDNNGYIDDRHGIAYDLDANPVPQLLHPLDELHSPQEKVIEHTKGFLDLQAAIDSPAATAVKKYLSSLDADRVQPFIEDLTLYSHHSHGTHVAGIAARGNPFIRLLGARISFDHHIIPRCPTIEQAKRDAQALRNTIDYFKKHNVRVVNMSWGGSRAAIEAALEQNGAGKNAEERAELSRKIFKIGRDALYDAIKHAPNILFVTSAGNADNDVEFDEMIPSGFNLPNLLVVGAVDQAGDPTGFTSFGRTVKIYANGFEVDSYIPGGKRMKFSGTSMSSPNVVNLAAKLLAYDPSLNPQRLIDLITTGGQKHGNQNLLLIHPQQTLALLKR